MNYAQILRAMFVIVRMKGVPVNPNQIAHDLALDANNITEIDLHKAAKALSFKVKKKDLDLEKEEAHYPVIAQDKEGNMLSLLRQQRSNFLFKIFKHHALNWLSVKKNAMVVPYILAEGVLAEALRRFDIKWFIPVIKKYKLFFEILAASFFIQLVALVTPLFSKLLWIRFWCIRHFQLNLVIIGTAAIALFEIILTLLKVMFLRIRSRELMWSWQNL